MDSKDITLIIVGLLALWMSIRIITYKSRKERIYQ